MAATTEHLYLLEIFIIFIPQRMHFHYHFIMWFLFFAFPSFILHTVVAISFLFCFCSFVIFTRLFLFFVLYKTHGAWVIVFSKMENLNKVKIGDANYKFVYRMNEFIFCDAINTISIDSMLSISDKCVESFCWAVLERQTFEPPSSW